MRSGINFNSPDGSASSSRPGDTGRLTENKRGSGYGDSILDDLFSDDDNSSSGRSDVSARGSNNLSGNSNQSVGSDYNPLLDDDDDDVNTPEKTVGSYRSASNSSGTGAHGASVRPQQNPGNHQSGSRVSRHSVHHPVKSDSVSRETMQRENMQTEGTASKRAPLRRPDAQQTHSGHDSVKGSSDNRRPLPEHNEPSRSPASSYNAQASSETPQTTHRRRTGIPSSSHSQDHSESTRTGSSEPQQEPQNVQGSTGNSSARQSQASNDSLSNSVDNRHRPDSHSTHSSDSLNNAIRNTESRSDSSDSTSNSLGRRPVDSSARHSVSRPSESEPHRSGGGQASNTPVSDRHVNSVSRETSSTDSTDSKDESISDNSSAIQSSTTNTGSSSGHYWVGSNVPGKKNTGYSADENDSTGIDEDGSDSNKSSSDPAPRKRGRGRPRNFLNTILPENRGNDFAERRWQGARQTKDFAPHVGFPVRSKEEEAELRRRQRAGETIPGRKKRDPNKKYHRKTITEKDILVFELAAITGACTYNPVAVLLGMKHASSARKRIQGLKEMKMLRTAHSLKIDGVMFDLTRRAVNQMYKNGSGVDKDCISLKKDVTGLKSRETSYHNTILAYTLAKECALHGLRPAMFYNEDWMARRCSGTYKGIGIEARNERVAEYRRQMMKAYRELSQGVREGIMERYPMLWVPCGKEDDLSNYSAWHQPDLILNRDWRNEKGQSKSVAYEIEMTPKSPGDMDKIMRTLGWSGWFAYGEVRYVVVSDMIGRAVERSRDRIVNEFRNLARTAPDSQDRAFYKSGANFLANALTIEKLSDMNGNLFDTGDQDWI